MLGLFRKNCFEKLIEIKIFDLYRSKEGMGISEQPRC